MRVRYIKSVKVFSACCLSFLFLLSSCAIEKRHYLGGYHTQWNLAKRNPAHGKKTKTEDPVHTQTTFPDLSPGKEADETGLASAGKPIPLSRQETIHLLKQGGEKQTTLSDSCDLIVCKNGLKISAKILVVGITEIKYKRCDNRNGPDFTIKKSEVAAINYPNGTQDVFETKDPEGKEQIVNVKAKRSLVFGISSIFFALAFSVGFILFLFAAIILSILAIVTGIMAKKQIRKNPDLYKTKSSRLAKAGIICGIAGLILVPLTFIVYFLFIFSP